MRIDARYCGPPTSANGGYASGRLAAYLRGPVEVTLRKPPPLDRTLRVELHDGAATLFDDDIVIAEGREAPLDLHPPPPVSLEEAKAVRDRFPWKSRHPYPTCFVCGIARPENDGLAIHPGRVEGRALVAAVWTPDAPLGEGGHVAGAFVWSALDCPSYFGFAALNATEEPVLLGRLHADLLRPVRLGEPCVVVGWSIGRDGRKIHAGSALFSSSGELYARARATWIVVAP